MTYEAVMAQLQSLSNEMILKHNAKAGVGENQFGVKMGDLRALAKQIKLNPELAAELWQSGNYDAMLLATLLMKPKLLTLEDLDRMVSMIIASQVADYFGTNVVKLHPQKEVLREVWMDSPHETTARLGWSLTAERIVKSPEGLNLAALLDRIESEMGAAPATVQWTMNFCLAEIGIHFAEHRDRAIAIGERIGAFRDYPTSKGCTSPYAPIWIAEMVSRKG